MLGEIVDEKRSRWLIKQLVTRDFRYEQRRIIVNRCWLVSKENKQQMNDDFLFSTWKNSFVLQKTRITDGVF